MIYLIFCQLCSVLTGMLLSVKLMFDESGSVIQMIRKPEI